MKDTPDVPPWEKVLEEIAQAGYSGTELGPFGFLPQQREIIQPKLADLGLELLSAYVQINLVDPSAIQDEYDETLATCQFLSKMGCQWAVLSDALFVNETRAARAGRVSTEDSLSGDDWKNFVTNANSFAKLALESYGLQAVYHPHVGAFVETADEVDRLMADSDDRYLNLCLDTAHCFYGGDDPVQLCRRWSERVRYLHLKECNGAVLDTVRLNEWDYFKGVDVDVFPELGRGSIDFGALLDTLKEMDFSGWAVVEQDILPGRGQNPLESAKRNLAYLKQVGY